MKKLMITATLLIGLISLGYSQNTPERNRPEKGRQEGNRPERSGPERPMKTPEERAKMSTDALEKKLNLSPEQKDKVYALNLERAEKMEKIHKSEMTFRKSQMEKHKEMMSESDKKLSKILTAEQQKTLEEMKANRMDRMKQNHRPMPDKRKG